MISICHVLGTDGTVSLCIYMHQYDDDKHGIAYKRLSEFSDVSYEIMTNANLGNDFKQNILDVKHMFRCA